MLVLFSTLSSWCLTNLMGVIWIHIPWYKLSKLNFASILSRDSKITLYVNSSFNCQNLSTAREDIIYFIAYAMMFWTRIWCGYQFTLYTIHIMYEIWMQSRDLITCCRKTIKICSFLPHHKKTFTKYLLKGILSVIRPKCFLGLEGYKYERLFVSSLSSIQWKHICCCPWYSPIPLPTPHHTPTPPTPNK